MRSVPPVHSEVKAHGARFLWIAAAVAVLGASILFCFNPAEYGFYPRCFLKVSTGLDCPGCGGLRAAHQLLHGHVAAAFALNPLFVLAIPIGALVLVLRLAEKSMGRRCLPLFSATTTVSICMTVLVAFGVLRNVPWRAWLGG